MAMSWVDYIVTIIVVGVVMGIFYRALKEPIDLVFGWIKAMFIGAKDKLGGEDEGTTRITYG
jgi:hypothetical protein